MTIADTRHKSVLTFFDDRVKVQSTDMAGRRHHHLWQLLQRGFSWKEHGDDHIWVHTKNCSPYKTVTRKFGRATEFYGPEGSAADSNITEFEGRVQSFLQDARRMPNGTDLDAAIVSPLIAHLEMRSLFIRSEMSRISERIVTTLKSHLASNTKVRTLLLNYLKQNSQTLIDFLKENGVPDSDLQLYLDLIDVKLPELLDNALGDLAPNLSFLFEEIERNLPEIAKRAHIRSLESDFNEVERTQLHSALIYRVKRFEVGTLLLPDTSLAFFKKSGLAPLSQKADKIEATVFPISSDVAIIGSRDGRFQRDDLIIQTALASCAFESFVANWTNERFLKLSSKIARNASLISEAGFQESLRFTKLLE